VEDLAPFGSLIASGGAVSNWWQKLAVARAGGLAAMMLVIGDSRAEGYTGTRYRNRWVDQLRRRFQGAAPGSMGFLPASANALSTVVDVDWAGGDNPWTYTGVTGAVAAGVGFHGAQCTSGTITLTYFGDVIQLYYQRTTGGPAAAGVTLDGVAQTALNANGSFLPGQVVSYGTPGSYGFHTLVISVSSGTLVFEGALWYDSAFNGFTVNGDVLMVDGTHAGFGAKDWAGANNDWSGMFQSVVEYAYAGLVLWCNGTNDAGAGRTPKQFEDDCVIGAQRLDARMLKSDLNHLFVILPSSNEQPYVDAAWRAAARLGLSRAGVIDLGQMRPGRTFGADLSTDGSHPNDNGQRWVAERLGAILDPFPQTRQPVTPTRQIISAYTTPKFRSSWAASVTPIAGTAHAYDEATASALRERRHELWLDTGTYQAIIKAEHATGRGILEVLIGNWQGNTPTLTSCGTVDTSTPAGPAITTTALPTQVVTQVPGWCPVVIRKTNQANVGRFVELELNKTA
jgi:lysophospholipase L1-like esterase